MMNKLAIFILISLLSLGKLHAQFGENILNKLGVGKVDAKPTYEFTGNVVQKFTMTKSNGKSTSFETQFFYTDSEPIVGTKIISSTDPDMKKALEMMDMTIIDLSGGKAYNFMNNNGTKMAMGIAYKDDKLSETIEKENQKIQVTKTDQTKTIMGHVCDGYKIVYEKENNNEIIMWVSQKEIPELAELGKNMAKSMGMMNSKGGRQNYLAYNGHPELLKMAQQGRATLGFSSIPSKGEKSEMEIIQVNAKTSYTFKASDYKSML